MGNTKILPKGTQLVNNNLTVTHPNIAQYWDYEKNYPLVPEMVTAGSHREVYWICPQGRSHSYKLDVRYRVKSNVLYCVECAKLGLDQVGVLQTYKTISLADARPDISLDWNYTKNAPLLPSQVGKGSNKIVWWNCHDFPQEHPAYQMKISTRTKEGYNCGCPICGQRKLIKDTNSLAVARPDIAIEWDFKKNGSVTPEMITSRTVKKAWWVCPKCKESYEASISARTKPRGSNCPFCSGRLPILGKTDLKSQSPNIAQEWDVKGNYPLTPMNVTVKSHKKVNWVCPNCQNTYELTVHSRTQNGQGCPYCAGKQVKIGYNDLKNCYPNIADDWDYDKNGDLLPEEVTKGSGKKVWWLCPKFKHSYKAQICNRTMRGTGCPYCSNHKVLKGFNDLATVCPDIAAQWDYSKNGDLLPTMVMRATNKRVWWKCNKGHSWNALISGRTSKNAIGCPYCNCTKGEQIIADILTYNNIAYIKEFTIHSAVDYFMHQSKFRYDFYLNDLGLFIEFDGFLHFSDAATYTTNGPSFEQRKKSDCYKNSYAFKNNKPLLRIPYIYDPEDNKEDIAKLLADFIKTKKIPQHIIDFYASYNFSNYAELARKWNDTLS